MVSHVTVTFAPRMTDTVPLTTILPILKTGLEGGSETKYIDNNSFLQDNYMLACMIILRRHAL